MRNLSDLTLIMPTYSRQWFALTQMRFWSDGPVKLHVLDGTAMPIKSEELHDIGDNVHYYHMPYSHGKRLKKAVDFIDTPYVALLCDDEFYIPSSLGRCITELEAHKDFVACIGRCLAFRSYKTKVYAKPMYPEMKNYRIDGENAAERMILHMNPYVCSTFYAVQRSEVWKKTMMIPTEDKFSSPYAIELQFELAVCYQGKSKVIEDLMWLRNKDNEPISFDAFNRKLQFDTWIRGPYDEEIKFFYENTATELAKINGVEKEKTLEDVKQAVDAYLDYCKKKRLLFSVAMLRDRIMQFIPKKLRTWTQSERTSRTWKPILKEAELMERDGVNVDMKQLEVIVKYMEDGRTKGWRVDWQVGWQVKEFT